MSILSNFRPSFLQFGLVREAYIETGSCRGDSFLNAARHKFSWIGGVELCRRHVDACEGRLMEGGFLKTSDPNNCGHRMYRRFPPGRSDAQYASLVWGRSVDGLDALIYPDRATTFWLDAHWPGEHADEWDPVGGQCPLLLELDVIRSYAWRVPPIIVIDDAYQLGCSARWWPTYGPGFPQFRPADWPTVGQIVDRLRDFTMLLNAGILYFWKA